jgi:uncharacterized protein YqfA (UPF0365 family)
MAATLRGRFSRALLAQSLLALICLSWWLASAGPVRAQPQRQPGQKQVVQPEDKSDRDKSDKSSDQWTGLQIAGMIALAFLVLIGVIILVVFFKFVGLFVQSWTNGAQISIFDLFVMKLRNIDYSMIVRQKIALVQANVKISTDELQRHYQSRGNVPKTAAAVIAAFKAGIDLPWKTAAAIDLAGRDVLDAVKTSVNPKVIDCPDTSKGRQTLDGVCKNGIQLKARARVTVRTKLERLVGGATEETIIARVGEGIVKAIGSADHHTDVLANPNLISQAVLKNSLDSQTAFEIVSIDVAEIDVGDNIGANLQANQAAADLRVAQAQAEKRRALAVAQEQEMRAKVEENRAHVIEAEAQVPLAIAQAFRDGRLGVMDYYNFRNLQADTEMRHSIAGVSGGTTTANASGGERPS